ncbi:hypothetical protein LBMAG53_36120 [Planctomycetota bacterium]|nr:hypothetical protein LBMAG53_36120 [Planctomycetota bacterium]
MPDPGYRLGTAMAVLASLALIGCQEEKSKRGLEVLPDMFHSPAYESQQALVGTTNGVDDKGAPVKKPWQASLLLTPPAGTVSRQGAPVIPQVPEFASSDGLLNPLLPTTAVLRLGQQRFGVYCAVCHGPRGDSSQSNVAEFLASPSLNDVNVVSYTDGGLHHVIARGKGRMPGYAAQLDERERWAVVHYLRALSWAHIATKDIPQVIEAAEAELRLHPENAQKRAEIEQSKKLLERRAEMVELIKQGGDGHAFHPPLPGRAEWKQAVWPGFENQDQGGGHH